MNNNIDLSNHHLFDKLTISFNNFLPRIPNAVFDFLVGYIVIRIISYITIWLLGFTKMPKGLKEIIVSLVDALLTVFLIIIVLGALGLGNVALAFSAGVAAIGLALGNGSVTLVQDVLAGIFLARDRDFSVGDVIRISGDAGDEGVQGVVDEMDMRRTRIRDEKGYLHIFPNSYIERREWVLITRKRDRK